MRKIDIFVSSPPDVQAERSVVERLIRSIAIEFNLPVTFTYSNRLRKSKPSDKIARRAAGGLEEGRPLLCPFIWEYGDFEPEQDNGERIPNTGQYDLVVCILWSRLGKISPSFVMPDASRPTSATEYEIASALDQVKRTPDFPELHLYRNLTLPVVSLEPKEEREIFCQRWDALQEFFSTWKSNRAFSGICSEYQDLREFEDLFRKHFRAFVTKQLDREIVPREPAPNTRYWKQNPFRGLEFFNFEHAAIFHGRTKAIGEVLVALKKQASAGHPFVLVIGPNGSGKSSLVRAGVLPILTEPGSTDGPWRRAIARPGVGGARGDPFKRLAAALLAEAALPELRDAEAPNGEENLASELGENPQDVARRVTDLLIRAGLQELDRVAHDEKNEGEIGAKILDTEFAKYRRPTRIRPEAHLALIIDPLDDLFNGDFSPELQRQYIDALVTLIRSKRVFVIATLRSAFYGAYQQFPELIELTGSTGKYDLAPPTPEEIGNMIRLPAEAAGLRFEQAPAKSYGLDQTIFDAAMTSTEPLPLLEHVLSELYRKQARRNDGLLRFSDYVALGELEGALGNHAETIFTMLMNDAQGAFASVMRRLVWFGGEGQGIGRMALYKEVASPRELKSRQKEGAKFLVDYFIKEGLFHADSDQTPERIVCITHQALLQKWPRVLQWLAENQAFLRMRDRLDAISNPTVRQDGRRADVFGPSFGVADAQTLLRHFRSSLSKTQIDYLKKSLARQKRARGIRDGIWLSAGSGLVVLAVVGGIQWYSAEIQKESAEALTGMERRIDEISGESRNGQDRSPNGLRTTGKQNK
jgi:energy-coupling factor transporter ATP-binding protein EcfA2